MQLFLLESVFIYFLITVRAYTIPDATVELIKPRGFRLSIPNEDGITEVSFNVKIDQKIMTYQPGDFAAIVKELTNDRWAFDNINTSISPGNKINYWIHVQFGKLGKNYRQVGTATVLPNTSEITNFCPAAGQPAISPAASEADCEPSLTTVGQRRVCKGQLIFEDNFDSLNWTKWDQEVRIPLDADDGQFVSFQSRPENCYVSNGQLHITPSLLSETINVKTGKLDLSAECTGFIDRSMECQRKAQNYQILPPIISARIRTRNSFSFRFGKIEIRAKLPKGDWLFPLILLEPLENYYGMRGYASGQIRIAFNRGNAILEDKNGKDISNQWIYGGVVMQNDEKLRGTLMGAQKMLIDLSKDFHIYTLTWNENRFIASVDGTNYASLEHNYSQLQKNYHGLTNKHHRMAPFDREFFLTLGLSAGGHSEFPDECRTGTTRKFKPWTNKTPKAELHFWNDRDNWYPSWASNPSGLHVDYVKVYAL